MVDVFEQVEEDLRSERYKRLARVWLPVVGGLLAVALIAALGWWGWQTLQTSQADKASAAYDRGMEALQADNTTAANAAFAEAAKAGNGAYKALALMQQAGLAQTANQPQEALRLFDEAAKAAGDPIIADPAALKAAFIVMDTGSPADAAARLEPLTAEGRPLRAFAQFALAMTKVLQNKTAEARDILVQLQLGQDVPDSVRSQAQAAVEMIDAGTAGALNPIVEAMKRLPPPPASPPAGAAPAAVAAAPAAPPAQ